MKGYGEMHSKFIHAFETIGFDNLTKIFARKIIIKVHIPSSTGTSNKGPASEGMDRGHSTVWGKSIFDRSTHCRCCCYSCCCYSCCCCDCSRNDCFHCSLVYRILLAHARDPALVLLPGQPVYEGPLYSEINHDDAILFYGILI